MNNYTPITSASQSDVVMFHRRELAVILSLYGQMVAMGEWRDYGISTLKDYAVFSVSAHGGKSAVPDRKTPQIAKQARRILCHRDGWTDSKTGP